LQLAVRDLLADAPILGANVIFSLADWLGDDLADGGRRAKAAGIKAWDGDATKIDF
jgi:hypothetical protein